MQTIKVRIKSFNPVLDSPYYNYLVSFPPKNVKFYGTGKAETVLSNPSFFKRFFFAKRVMKKAISISNLPNLVFSLQKDADIFQCSHCLLLNDFRWVVDFEDYWAFSVTSSVSSSSIGKSIIAKMLKKNNCRKILPWTVAAKNKLSQAIKTKEILDKCDVVYPAVPTFGKTRSGEIPSMLFIGRYFFQKGGLFFIKAVEKLKKKYDFDATMISFTVPRDIQEKYKNIMKIFKSVDKQTLLKKVYPSTDIFFYPGFSDSFGFALLEAMSFGIPIVTADAFARREIIEDGKNGFVLRTPEGVNEFKLGKKEDLLVAKMVEKISVLIEDENLRKKIGRQNRRAIERGKFSINVRNKKLREIYEGALKY